MEHTDGPPRGLVFLFFATHSRMAADDEYARALASMSVAHVISIAGCDSAQKSALNALVDIMKKCMSVVQKRNEMLTVVIRFTKNCA